MRRFDRRVLVGLALFAPACQQQPASRLTDEQIAAATVNGQAISNRSTSPEARVRQVSQAE